MTFYRPGADAMTELELDALAREVVPLDPLAFPGEASGVVAAFNRRAKLLEELLREAAAVLESGSRIAPALARTIRVAASALRVRRARLVNGPGRSQG
jgi:hypothetical protein